MKNLVSINEWKNSTHAKLDESNVNELNDIFLPNKVTSESIRKHKDNLVKFNNLQEETHDILERLISIGYDISYYSVDSGANYFEIRLGKKN